MKTYQVVFAAEAEDDIAEIVSKWTGIPVARMLEGEVEKLV